MSFLYEIQRRLGLSREAEPLLRSPGNRAAVSFATSLRFDRIGKRFEDIQAVEEVSFEVEPGEIVCLLGPSGCGKRRC